MVSNGGLWRYNVKPCSEPLLEGIQACRVAIVGPTLPSDEGLGKQIGRREPAFIRKSEPGVDSEQYVGNVFTAITGVYTISVPTIMVL